MTPNCSYLPQGSLHPALHRLENRRPFGETASWLALAEGDAL